MPDLIEELIITDTVTIRKKVHRHIREQILNGEIGPNERLVEARIARSIGTSRTPVREALHSLELEGLIESIPRVGYRVKQISDSEAVEIWEIRGLIEGLAARWACENDRTRLAKELRRNINLSEERVSKGELTAFVDLDGQFHEIIARLSGGRRLLELAQSLRRYALRYRLESICLPDTALRAIEGHKNILRAVEKNEPEALSHAICAHLEQSKQDTLRYAFQGGGEKKKG
jgi:GntR family transcriptional regulator, rspAB operon transcriptional repressor